MKQQAIVDRPGGEERAARARIDAAAKLLRGDKSDVPDDFAALLFGRAAPEDLVGYEAGRACGAGARGLGVLCGPQARRAENPVRAARLRRGRRLKSISVIEIVNDDMPFLVDSVMAELTERGLDAAPGRPSDPGGRARQEPASSRRRRSRPATDNGRDARELHPYPRRAHRRCGAPRRDRARRWSRCWPRSGAALPTGGR